MGAARVGTGGLVTAKQRGDKGEDRPVKILTKQKGSGVTSGFTKNR